MRILLTVTEGPHSGREFAFTGHDTFIVGRSTRAHFRLAEKDKYFSRTHFLVEVNPPCCRVMDLGSRNGTFVNDIPVKAVDLKDGDRIRAGRTTLSVGIEAPPEPPAPPSEFATRPPSWPPAPWPRPDLPLAAPETCSVCGRKLSGGAPRAQLPAQLCSTCRERVTEVEQSVPGYRLLWKIGQGGMGIVWLALREAGGLAAVKMVTPAVMSSAQHVERFLREASILRQLQHPHIVAYLDAGEQADGKLYFAMEYVPGIDADRLVEEQGPMAPGRAVGLACQLLDALAYAHGRSYVHRDIKPANVLIHDKDGGEYVHLTDFGLARVYQASRLSGLTLQNDVGGSVAFMAPEQITSFRDATPAADQYSAAATLYWLLSGRFMYDFPPSPYEQLRVVLSSEPAPLRTRRDGLPAGLDEIVHRALSREPAQRFSDVNAFRDALLIFAPA